MIHILWEAIVCTILTQPNLRLISYFPSTGVKPRLEYASNFHPSRK